MSGAVPTAGAEAGKDRSDSDGQDIDEPGIGIGAKQSISRCCFVRLIWIISARELCLHTPVPPKTNSLHRTQE